MSARATPPCLDEPHAAHASEITVVRGERAIEPEGNGGYPFIITDHDSQTLEVEADHRRHAEIENAIRDLKYGVGLNHLPSEHFAANGAWLAVQVIANNLARWAAYIGFREQVATTKTMRCRFFSMIGRITRSPRRLALHLPARWPWEGQLHLALARLASDSAPSPSCRSPRISQRDRRDR